MRTAVWTDDARDTRPGTTCNVVRATFNYAGYVERLRFHLLLDQALRNGWDFERPGPVFRGMSEGQARRMVAYSSELKRPG